MFLTKLSYFVVKQFLRNKFTVKTIHDTVTREKIYIRLPYIEKQSTLLKKVGLKFIKKYHSETGSILYLEIIVKLSNLFLRKLRPLHFRCAHLL